MLIRGAPQFAQPPSQIDSSQAVPGTLSTHAHALHLRPRIGQSNLILF